MSEEVASQMPSLEAPMEDVASPDSSKLDAPSDNVENPESDERLQLTRDARRAPKRFFLPSRKYQIVWAAQHLFRALAASFAMFVHAGVVVELAFYGKRRAELRDVTAQMARSRF